MKKKIIGLVGILSIFIGCGNNPQPEMKCQIDGATAPSWICKNVDNNSTIYAVGSAEKSPLGFNFQKTEALSNGRDELSRKIKLKVKNMTKNFMSSTGIGNAQTAEKVFTDVSKQVSYNTITGSSLEKIWLSPKKTLFILVGVKRNLIASSAKKAVKTSLHNDQALWQKFLAQKADKQLDEEVKKDFK